MCMNFETLILALLPKFMDGNQQSRVKNGKLAPKPIPWQVYIRNSTDDIICGGTIIDRRTVITAAECFDSQSELDKDIRVVAGSLKVRKKKSGVKIRKVIYNDQKPFNLQTRDNNIVLLRLRKRLKVNAKVKPVCLPPTDFDPRPSTTDCFISGWGHIQGLKEGNLSLYYLLFNIIYFGHCCKSYFCSLFEQAELGKSIPYKPRHM